MKELPIHDVDHYFVLKSSSKGRKIANSFIADVHILSYSQAYLLYIVTCKQKCMSFYKYLIPFFSANFQKWGY